MGLTQRLARLDAVVVPRLGRGARRLAGLRPASWALPVAAVLAVAAVAATTLLTPRGGAPTSQVTVGVGVSDGDSVPRYLAAGQAKLAQLRDTAADRPVYALTSFSAYLTPNQVATVVAATGGLATIAASARVPLPHRQTELIRLGADRLPDDLVAAMLQVADRKVRDATSDAARATVSSGAAGAQAASDAEVETVEAEQYRGQCACVYALVVRATPVVLTRLARRPEVRGVDPAPQLTGLTGVIFRAPLPEQADVVAPPDDDAMPDVTPAARPGGDPGAGPTRRGVPVSTG